MKKVSVITPWRDHPDLIPDYERTVAGGEVIVIDNSSEPGSAYEIRDMVRRLGGKYIRNDNNRMFAAANNQGLNQAHGDIALFLNNDVRGGPKFLGAVSDDVADGEFVGPSLQEVIVYGMRLPYLEGWCLAGPRVLFERLGGWDAEAFPDPYWEDVDLCMRALRAGISLRRADWSITHKIARTAGSLVDWGEVYERNRAKFAQRVRPIYDEILAARGQRRHAPSKINQGAEPIRGQEEARPMLHTQNPLLIPKDPGYYHHCRKEAIDLLVQYGIRASRVLELGCSAGHTGRKLKQFLDADFYAGIDYCGEAVRQAQLDLDRVYEADLDRSRPADVGLSEQDFDLLVGLDVLEHLYDPWEVLASFARCLKLGAYTILSIPNIQNINVLSGLAEGKWNYEGSGLLDVSHIRFFTFDGIKRLVSGAGLSLVAARGVIAPHVDLDGLLERGNTVSRSRLTLSALSREEVTRLFTFQYLVLARRSTEDVSPDTEPPVAGVI